MDPITQQGIAGAAGAAGDPVYVDDIFSIDLFRNNNNSAQINNDIDLAGEGGLVLMKYRDANSEWAWVDSERGVSQSLDSQGTNPQYTKAFVNSFDSDGFTHGSYVGTSNSSSIVSYTLRKQKGFFDVVTFTGTGSVQNISHSLGSVPGMIIVKKTSGTGAWNVYHRSSGANGVIYLHGTHGNSVDNGVWNNTAPTSSVFTVGADVGVNANGSTYVAYVFAHDDQSFGTDSDKAIIKCGSFVIGSGATSDVDLGFEPQFVLTKLSSTTGNWLLSDVMRGTADTEYNYLQANASSAESTLTGGNFYTTSTGFHYESLGSAGNTVVYMAIRRPHKPPTAGTEVFAMDTGSSSSTTPTWDSGFTVDMSFVIHPNSNSHNRMNAARLLGPKYLSANNTDPIAAVSSFTWDSNVGWGKDYNYNGYSYMYRRAPGFFDVVTYTGTGSARTVNHNLTVAPELLIVKCRTNNGQWAVYNAIDGASKALTISISGIFTFNPYWNSTAPTATQFTVATDGAVNNNTQTYIAYLFATLDGISKVGSYTGTGYDVNVDCGFSAGARFVLIKRTDSTGDWYVFDTLRGIASGNDPYFVLNTYAAQVTNTDYIDPLNAGFTVTSSAPAALNASGGTYLFLAIA